MGLGGYLFWTAAAREIHSKILGSNSTIKFLPLETSQNGILKLIKSEIFANNPYFFQEFNQNQFAFPLVLNNSQLNYCKLDTPEYAKHRYDKHVIEQICEFYGIDDPELKCEIYFTQEEENKISELLIKNEIPEKFVVIEPQSNEEYSINKVYPLEKWQNVVNDLVDNGVSVVQVGRTNPEKILKNAINLTGETSFREAALIIKKSMMFISTEGGLMHAANAVETRSLIVYTGYIHPKMTGYEGNFNLWIGKNHGPCGMKILCESCQKESLEHNEKLITSIIRGYLSR